MRVIIAAAGGQGKWGNHRGVPSHLVPVEGVPLLSRTVRQALIRSGDVHVTVPDDRRYRAPGATRHLRTAAYPSEYDSTRDLWNEHGRTVLLYGDVFFTDRALDTITGYRPAQYRCFGRAGRSRLTGCRYGEVFAASWHPEQHDQLDALLDQIAAIRARGECTRPTAWMLLRAMQGTPLHEHRVDPRWFTEINDLTEDFDFPADYDRHPASRRPAGWQRRAVR